MRGSLLLWLLLGGVAHAGPFGSRTQLGAALREVGQPDRATKSSFVQRQPVLNRVGAFLHQAAVGKRGAQLNRRGVDVILMDQQWAGYTKGGSPGGIDRAFGISRDVAAVTAFAAQVAERDYRNHPGRQVVVTGVSMGGGPGVVGALALN